jgi:hypothetical protein
MSQKNALQTLRPAFKSTNLINLAPLKFLKAFNFLRYLNDFFAKKSILIVDNSLNFIGEKAQLSLSFFVQTAKVIRFSRRVKTSSIKFNQADKFIFSDFILKELKEIKVNCLSLKFILLNKVFLEKQNSRLLKLFYLKHRFFKDSLFNRRNNLFFDFLKISCLFSKGLVNLKTFMFALVQTFRFLPKQKHARFLNFINRNFAMLLEEGLKKNSKGSIAGLKFLVAGKLKGKLRKKKFSIQVGKVPIQSIDKNVDFVRAHVFTRYGAFGFKLWSYRI